MLQTKKRYSSIHNQRRANYQFWIMTSRFSEIFFGKTEIFYIFFVIRFQTITWLFLNCCQAVEGQTGWGTRKQHFFNIPVDGQITASLGGNIHAKSNPTLAKLPKPSIGTLI